MEEKRSESPVEPSAEVSTGASPRAFAAPRRPQAVFLRAALIALLRERLRQTKGGRFSALLGISLLAGFGVIALVLRAVDGPSASLGNLVVSAAKLITWAAAAPIAFAAANDRARADRDDGIEALAESHGIDRYVLRAVRVAAAMYQVAHSIGLPILILSLLSVLLSGTIALAVKNIALMLGLAFFSALAGCTIGGIADLCGRIGMARGRHLFALVIVLPWLLSDLSERPWSIPGALNAALNWIVRTSGFSG